MSYDIERLRKEITDGRKSAAINRAKYHQSRIKFHVTKRVGTAFVSPWLAEPLTQFLYMSENILPHDKFVQFKNLFRYPVRTNEITGVCFDKLSRIFDGANAAYNYQFVAPEYLADWEQYRAERLREPMVWSTKGWEYFKTEINSVLIVDLPREQRSEMPEPYFYWLPIDDVLTYDADPTTGQMKYIAYRDRHRHIIVLDDTSYRVYDDKKDAGTLEEAALLSENRHDLGYCPARFFWSDSISLDDPDVKESPLTKVLEQLDWYLFFHISKRQLDLMGAYPILSGYEPRCDYSNAENGDYCDGGFLRDKQGRYKMDMAGLLQRCPKCGSKRIVGAGSFVEIPVPNAEEGQPDLRNPVQMLTVDRNSLDYNVDEQTRLRSEIITAVVGQDVLITNRDAFNEQQVQANFEEVTTVLNRVKRGFEMAQQWVDSTVCRLRYGKYFISASVSYGDRFYLQTTQDLRDIYQKAKQAGASESVLDGLQQQMIETEYRNKPGELQRMQLLAELEPYPHLTLSEIEELYSKGVISASDMRLKLNFSNFVKRFERENMNVAQFGAAIPYEQKIQAISQQLKQYADEMA